MTIEANTVAVKTKNTKTKPAQRKTKAKHPTGKPKSKAVKGRKPRKAKVTTKVEKPAPVAKAPVDPKAVEKIAGALATGAVKAIQGKAKGRETEQRLTREEWAAGGLHWATGHVASLEAFKALEPTDRADLAAIAKTAEVHFTSAKAFKASQRADHYGERFIFTIPETLRDEEVIGALLFLLAAVASLEEDKARKKTTSALRKAMGIGRKPKNAGVSMNANALARVAGVVKKRGGNPSGRVVQEVTIDGNENQGSGKEQITCSSMELPDGTISVAFAFRQVLEPVAKAQRARLESGVVVLSVEELAGIIGYAQATEQLSQEQAMELARTHQTNTVAAKTVRAPRKVEASKPKTQAGLNRQVDLENQATVEEKADQELEGLLADL